MNVNEMSNDQHRLECLKRQDDDVRALREIGALEPARIQALKAKAITRLCEGIASIVKSPIEDGQREVGRRMREKWQYADWRDNRALLRTMHELLQNEPLLALPGPEEHP